MTLRLSLVLIAAICCVSAVAQDAVVTVSSPLDYQVFQRRTRLHGTILVRGSVLTAIKVEARVEGTSIEGPLPARWRRMTVDAAHRQFSGELPVIAGGFYRVEIMATDAAGKLALITVPNVGVGEVFVISGQSNSTNYGEVRQKTETGMVASFSGTEWVLANDPQLGVQDNSKDGSFIPSFGDALYRRYHIPIGIASVGHGSTSVRQWLPAGMAIHVMPTMPKYVKKNADGMLVSDGTLFDGMMTRICQLGPHGFRALLWHQGESDSHQSSEHEIDATTYQSMMVTLIRTSRKKAGWHFPWFVAQASYHTPEDTGARRFERRNEVFGSVILRWKGQTAIR